MVDISDQARVRWHGRWIWASYPTPRHVSFMDRHSEPAPFNRAECNVFLLFRHHIYVKSPLKQARINITVDSRYKLFINGKYIGRGINRCESVYWYYNVHDITPYLQVGDNVVAVHARYYGMDFAFYTQPTLFGSSKSNSGKGGLLFDVQLTYADGHEEWIGTDTTTKVTRNQGERSDMPLKGGCLGYLEECDLRKVPRDWNELEFDDAAWENAEIYDYPIKNLLLDENAPLHEEFHRPAILLKLGETDDYTADILEESPEDRPDFNVQSLTEHPVDPITNFDIIGHENLLSGKGVCEIRPKGDSENRAVLLFFQFAKEMVGYAQIRVEGPAGAIVDVIPSEKRSGDMPGLEVMGSKRGFRITLREGPQFFELWDWEGYLYMLVKVRNLTAPVKIHSLGTNVTHMRLRGQGKFHCDQEKLNRLWEACAHTVKCCAIDGYLDCPSREQRSYLGDAYPEALIANACFGEPRLTKKLVYDSCFGQLPDGIMFSFHPGDARREAHIIPDYTLYLIQITKDYYQYYGDEKVLDDTFPHFVRAMEWFWKYIDPATGLLLDIPYWCFIDWSFGHEKKGYWAIINAQFMNVLEYLAKQADRYLKIPLGEKYRTQAALIKSQLNALLWDDKEGCYRDYLFDGQLHGFSWMTNAYLILMDVADAAKIPRIMQRIFEYPGIDADIIKQIDDYYLKRLSHHAFGDTLSGKVVVAQPFFMHQVNKCFAKIGRFDLLMKYLHKWEPMLELGQTGTIWETWSIAASECHAWAATPAYDLSTYWLGVKPLTPGFATVQIAPTFHELQFADGIFPTDRGDITVKWTKSDRHVELTIQIPPKIDGGICLIPPLDGKAVKKVETSQSIVSGSPNGYQLQPGVNHFQIYY
jgi:hypothetical protein